MFRRFSKLVQQFLEAQYAARQLVLYRSLLNDEVIQEYLLLLDYLTSPLPQQSNWFLSAINAYHQFYAHLLHVSKPKEPLDLWQNYLRIAILHNENPFSLQAERTLYEQLDFQLREALIHDLDCLHKMYQVNLPQIHRGFQKILEENTRKGANFSSVKILSSQWEKPLTVDKNINLLFPQFASTDYEKTGLALAEHYRKNGCGLCAQYSALRWESKSQCLRGIAAADPVTFDQLVAYQIQQDQLLQNTEFFLSGQPAQHVLLYGKRGTGKSSMVKALLNRYQSKGLRLIELPSSQLQDLPVLVNLLRDRVFRFLVFIDDLSFENQERNAKLLKTALEGGIETFPSNVLVYGTSNRRHLVKTYFTDRNQSEEIHPDETMQEKLSLVDRFGLAIYFPGPSQQVFLQIVTEIAERRNLNISQPELHQKALEWEKWHNGLSGRTARQFIDTLEAELKTT